VTQASHGLITRDGVKPQSFKEIVLKELRITRPYPIFTVTVTEIIKNIGNERFTVKTSTSQEFVSEKIILTTGTCGHS